MHASLHCHVSFICSVIFTKSRNVDCGRDTDTREERREGIDGEGREDGGKKYARHMNFPKFLTIQFNQFNSIKKLAYTPYVAKVFVGVGHDGWRPDETFNQKPPFVAQKCS